MPHNRSVQSECLVSDEKLQDWMNHEIHCVLHVERSMSREELADKAHISVAMLDAIRKTGEGRRKITPGMALSLCYAMGERRVNGLLAHIGFGGASRLGDEPDTDIRNIVVSVLPELAKIGECAKDGRIDHTEEPITRPAADMIISQLIPLSSFHKS